MTKEDLSNRIVKYRFLDYFNQEWKEIKALVLQESEKTTLIAILEYGPRGKQPGETMRVHNKNIIWPKPEPGIPEWHAHTDI